jgi:lambda family phage minor tail protein L
MLIILSALLDEFGNDIVAGEIQKLSPSSIIELYEIDSTNIGGDIYRFHSGKNGLTSDVVWAGQTYSAFPIEVSGFEWNGKGQLPRPKVNVGNALGTISALVLTYQDLIGCKFTRIRTLQKFLDAVNFPPQRNLLNYTESFELTSIWVENASASVDVIDNITDVVSPIGTNNVQKLIEADTATATRLIRQSFGSTLAAGSDITFSVYAKLAERNIRLSIATKDSVGYGANFDLSAGTAVGAITTGLLNYGISDAGNGWWRCWISVDLGLGAATPGARLQLLSGSIQSYAGVVGSGVYIWGAQAETTTPPSKYQAVTGASFSRNPTADPTAEFARDVYFVDRKSQETRIAVEFELSAALDLTGVGLPRRQVIQNYCPWQYRGTECGWTGDASGSGTYSITGTTLTATVTNHNLAVGDAVYVNLSGGTGDGQYMVVTAPTASTFTVTVAATVTGSGTLDITQFFDTNDAPVTLIASDVCGKRLASCRARFGFAELPFGGFPASGLLKL